MLIPEPALPAHQRKTYQIVSPRPTHFRAAGCEEAGCKHMREGWRTIVDESSDLGAQQAYYIRHSSGRSFTEHRDEDGLTVFTFAAGQECFREHKVRLEREEIYVVRGGDHRGNPRGERRVHRRAEEWVEDFAEHQEALRRAQS